MSPRQEVALIVAPFGLVIAGLVVFSCVRDAVLMRPAPIEIPLHP